MIMFESIDHVFLVIMNNQIDTWSIEYKFIINNDLLVETFKEDYGTMKIVTTSFDNLDGINTYIKNIEETVYENE